MCGNNLLSSCGLFSYPVFYYVVVSFCSDNQSMPKSKTQRLTRQLSEMFELGSECAAVRELVLESHDVFAIEEGERGLVKDVKHEIDTGDSPPIRQPARRVPFALRGKVAGLVEEMLSAV